MNIKQSVRLLINFPRLVWCWILYIRSDNKNVILEDLSQIDQYHSFDRNLFITDVLWGLLVDVPFRSVFFFRVSNQRHLTRWAKKFIYTLPQIEIYGKPNSIGAGLHIYHNMGVVISAHSVGKYCQVRHGVTIGENRSRHYPSGRTIPVLGDYVDIGVNAVIIGGITVGSNVTIGAGAVVVDDVPDYCTVAGVPARITKREHGA